MSKRSFQRHWWSVCRPRAVSCTPAVERISMCDGKYYARMSLTNSYSISFHSPSPTLSCILMSNFLHALSNPPTHSHTALRILPHSRTPSYILLHSFRIHLHPLTSSYTIVYQFGQRTTVCRTSYPSTRMACGSPYHRRNDEN